MSEQFKVSVCICTRNRPDNLKKALDSLSNSTYPIFDIIVSDDSTNSDTETLMHSHYPNVKYLPGPRKGLGANRNNALKAVNGTHVIYLDDDAVLGEKFLETVFACLKTDTEKTGHNIHNTIITGLQLDHGNLIFPHEQDFFGHQKIDYKEGDCIKTVVINSAVFPVGVFEKVLFDDKLVYGCDEVDFTTRAVNEGFKIILCPEAVNFHYPSLVNRDFYQPYHEASRIYVTFKRYFSTEKNKLKALLFLGLAAIHTALHSIKNTGIQGVTKAIKTLRLVSSYMSLEYSPKDKLRKLLFN